MVRFRGPDDKLLEDVLRIMKKYVIADAAAACPEIEEGLIAISGVGPSKSLVQILQCVY